MSLKKQAIKGLIWSTLQQFSNLLISFVASIFLSRILNPSEFGLVAMIGILIAVGRSLIDSGMTQSLIRTKDYDDEDVNTIFLFNLIVSVIIYSISFFIAPFVANFYKQPLLVDIIRIQCISFVISAFSTMQLTQLTKKLDFKTQFKISTPSIFIGSLLSIILALSNFGVWALVFGTLAQSFVVTVQVWFWSSWRPNWRFNKNKFKQHFYFGYKLTVSGIIDTFYQNIYTIVIGKYFSPSEVGFYSRADTLKQLPVNSLGVILNKVTFPLFAKIQDDNIKLKEAYKQIIQLVIFIVTPAVLFIAALAEPIFIFLFTEKWLPAVTFFQILCWNGVLHPIQSYNLNILKIKGRTDLFLKIELIKKLVLTVIVLISIPLGIKAMLYGSVVFSIISFVINSYYSGKLINYRTTEQLRDVFKYILLSTIIAGILFYVDSSLFSDSSNYFLRIFIEGLLAVIAYFGIVFLLKWQVIYYLKKLIKR